MIRNTFDNLLFLKALCNSQVDKYDSRISKKGCCISVHVKLLPLQECYEYSASALSKSERRMYDKICTRQSNNTLRNGIEGKVIFEVLKVDLMTN